MAKKRPKKTHFVPHGVLAAAFVGTSVVPVCVASCGGDDTAGSKDATSDSIPLGVAAPFDARPNDQFSVADAVFTVAAPFDANDLDRFSVADVGFGDSGKLDGSKDGSEAG